MKRLTFSGTTGLVALVVAGALAASATASTIVDSSGTAYPVGSSHQFRSSTNATFNFPNGGSFTCLHAYSVIANGVTNANTFGTTDTQIGTLSSIYFGNNLLTSATASKACNSAYPNISSCTIRPITSSTPVKLRNTPSSGTATGVIGSIGPLTVIADCVASGGGTISGCTYQTGPGSPAAVTATGTYSGTPARVSTVTISNAPFYKTAGPASCPAATSTSTGSFSVSLQLFGSAGQQLYAQR